MRIALIGADLEENLGLGILAAVAERAGWTPIIVPFNRARERAAVVERVLGLGVDAVGLGIQFQHRAHEHLRVARDLRARGYRGHVTAGGQFPTLAADEVLSRGHGVDSVVLYEAEETLPELLAAIASGTPLADVAGLALRTDDGAVVRTRPRPLVEDLDHVPFPMRYRAPARHLGVPFVPIMGSRGCWGRCTYCAITSFHREAHAESGGKKLRLRSPENVATEMAILSYRTGEPSIFCFHDDNFLLPRPEASLARVEAIRAKLDALGVGPVAMIGKCRPETLTPELARRLAELGVLRLYVGVENASADGAEHLGRGTQTAHVHDALEACRAAGIFVCYNLLVFEPWATLADVRTNLRFIREHAHHPVNFCRAEPYFGTPLHRTLERRGELGGSYLGWNYRIADDRAELLFRITSAAFRERNFAPDGVANRSMGVGYVAKVLETFHGDRAAGVARVRVMADLLTQAIVRETADFLERALELAETIDPKDHDRLERETVRLGLELAEADAERHAELDRFYADAEVIAERAKAPAPKRREVPRALRALFQAMSLGVGLSAVSACEQVSAVDPVPPPTDAGLDGGVDVGDAGGMDVVVVDPPPPDAAILDADVLDADSGDGPPIVDPPPPDAAILDADAPDVPPIVDPPPPDAAILDADAPDVPPIVDPAPEDASVRDAMGLLDRSAAPTRLAVIDRWTDSAPRRASRSRELALWDPPELVLEATRDGATIVVDVKTSALVSLKAEARGGIDGDGPTYRWTPADADDRLRVAARSRGGVAIASLGAKGRTTSG
ncbi:B12-binding domain-containing radical SAM protein [Myxococcota bacterium]|nr:B12-binding domain-containing radical SAM protein [Myxococcota bacterium]